MHLASILSHKNGVPSTTAGRLGGGPFSWFSETKQKSKHAYTAMTAADEKMKDPKLLARPRTIVYCVS